MHTDGAGFLIGVLVAAALLLMFWRVVAMVIATSVVAVFLIGVVEIVLRLRRAT